MQNIDLVISSGLNGQRGVLCTMNAQREVKEDFAIAIHEGKILEISDQKTILSKYHAAQTIDATNCIVMPGLVNTHTHSPLTFLRGVSDDLVLADWLHQVIFPLEKRFVTKDFVRVGTRLAVSEMLLSGTTTFNDSYFFSREIAEVAKQMGMRCVSAEGILDFPTPSHANSDDALGYAKENLQQWKNDELITPALSPHALYTCSQETIEKIFKLSQQYDALVHIHLSESRQEVLQMQEKYGQTPVGVMEKWGVLNQNVIAAHCVHLSDADIELLAKRQVGICHNPESNMKLGNGVAPVSALLKRGAVVGLGTDSAASNNDLSLLHEIDFAAKLQKGFYGDSTLMASYEAVEMLTLNGAKVLHLEDKIGSIEVGKQADIILLELNRPHLTPIYNPYSHIVYSASGADVKTVVVNGRVVVQNRELVGVSLDDIYGTAHEYADQVKGFL